MNDTTGINLYRLHYCINKIYILPVKMIFSELDRGTFVYMHLYAKWYSKINLISRRLIKNFIVVYMFITLFHVVVEKFLFPSILLKSTAF